MKRSPIPTTTEPPLEFCPICMSPRTLDGDVCDHWVDDVIDGCVEWNFRELPFDLNVALHEFSKAWLSNTPKSRDTTRRVLHASIPRYLKKVWVEGFDGDQFDMDARGRSGRAKTEVILRVAKLRRGVPASKGAIGSDRCGLYLAPEDGPRVARAIEAVKKATQVIEEIHDDVLFDIYFDEAIKHGEDPDEICRDLDFEQFKHDRWLLTLSDEDIEKLAEVVVDMTDRMKQDHKPVFSEVTTQNIRNAEMLGYELEVSEADEAHDEALAQSWSDASEEVEVEKGEEDPSERRTKWRN